MLLGMAVSAQPDYETAVNDLKQHWNTLETYCTDCHNARFDQTLAQVDRWQAERTCLPERLADIRTVMAREFAAWVDADAAWERLAPVPMSVVCFRWAPAGTSEAERDAANARILEQVNASGRVYLSHTKLDGRYTIRLAIGNLRTERRHVAEAWSQLRGAAAQRPMRPL